MVVLRPQVVKVGARAGLIEGAVALGPDVLPGEGAALRQEDVGIKQHRSGPAGGIGGIPIFRKIRVGVSRCQSMGHEIVQGAVQIRAHGAVGGGGILSRQGADALEREGPGVIGLGLVAQRCCGVPLLRIDADSTDGACEYGADEQRGEHSSAGPDHFASSFA